MFISNGQFRIYMSYVSELMTKNVVIMDVNKSALEAASLMMEKNISTLVLTKNNEPVGMVTERDFLRRICAKNLKASEIKLEQIMSSPLITIEPTVPIEMAAATMEEKRIRRLVVVQNRKMLGILTGTDLIKNLQQAWNRKLDYLLEPF